MSINMKNINLENFCTKNTRHIILFSISIVVVSRILMYLLYNIAEWGTSGNFIYDICNIWDNGWYRGLVLDGYRLEPTQHVKGDAANWAFFPLTALIIRAVMYIFSADVNTIAFLVNNLFLILAIIVSIKYILFTRKNKELAVVNAILLAFGPYTFYFSCFYTESLYLFLFFLSMYFLKKEKYIQMGICGALLSATRNTGVMFVFVIAVVEFGKAWKKHKSICKTVKEILNNSHLVVGTMLVPSGLFLYMAYLWHKVGDPLAFVRIQKAWGFAEKKGPLLVLEGYFSSTDVRNWYLAIFAIISCIIVIQRIFKGKLDEMIMPLIILGILLPTTCRSIPRMMLSSGTFGIGILECIWTDQITPLRKFVYFIVAIVWSLIMFKLWLAGDGIMQ